MKAPTAAAATFVSPAEALAFRVATHDLAERVPLALLVDAARGGMRERPPDGAALALRARVDGLSAANYEGAVAAGDLVGIYAMRGAVYVVPRDAHEVFVAATLPSHDRELEAALGAWSGYLDARDIDPTHAYAAVTDAVTETLATANQPLTKGELSERLHGLVPSDLEPPCPGCNASHVPEPLFRLAVSTSGATVVLGRTPTTFVAGTPPTDKPNRRRTAGTELARWFLHLYGPALPEHFAAWRGFPAASGHEKFTMLGDEVTPVTFDGRRAWALTTDLPVLTGAPSAKGVRLLPRDDPFTAQRDRATLAPTKELQRRLWTGLGTSAVVLVDGALAGLWRGRKERGRFTVTVEAIRPIPVPARKLLEAEAAEFASFRGASDSAVQINPK